MKGKKISKETRQKISKANTGKKHSEEHKKKISDTLKGRYCGENNPFFGKHHNEESKKKMSEANLGRKLSEEHKKKIGIGGIGRKFSEESRRKKSESQIGEKGSNWKGGVYKKNIPLFNTYAHQIRIYEEARCSEEGCLEVRCTYCGKWFMPKLADVRNRIKSINGNGSGESRLYCSKGCKQECPIFGKSPEQLMKEDAIRAGRILPYDLNREVQPELRQLVFLRDNYECQICGSNSNLHCHHYEGIEKNPIESADVDNCITLCKKCHIYKAHSQPSCSYYNMRRRVC